MVKWVLAPAAQSGTADNLILGVSGLVGILAVISVILRFYTRISTRQGLYRDDWLILLAIIATFVTVMLLLASVAFVKKLIDSHESPAISPSLAKQIELFVKLDFATLILYFTGAGATKLGILCMYYRIFSVSQGFRYCVFLAAGLVIAWWVGCTVALCTSCTPIQWSWLITIKNIHGPLHCFSLNIFWVASGACEVFLDVLILTLPIGVLAGMQFSWQRKLTISGIFLLGGLVVVTGIVRVVLGYDKHSTEPSYRNTEVWTATHAGVSIICANLPILNPLVKRIKESSLVTKLSTLLSRAKTTRKAEACFILDGENANGHLNCRDGIDDFSPSSGIRTKKKRDPYASLLETSTPDIESGGELFTEPTYPSRTLQR